MDQPRYHTTEDGYRVTIVFKMRRSPTNPSTRTRSSQLFPDEETYLREEQRRFEILDAHWDLPVKTVD